MLTNFFRIVVNVLYLVPLKVRIFRARYPNENILAAGGSKGICLKQNQPVSRGVRWILAKRAALILSDRRLVCGSWNIELGQIKNAQMIKIQSISGKALVLKISTQEGKYYQFGLQYDSRWLEQKALPLEFKEGKILSSPFIIIARLILLGYIIWWFIKQIQ